MSLCSFTLFIAFIFQVELVLIEANDYSEFGPYKVEFGNYVICRGPKSTDAGTTSSVLKKHEDNNYKAVINITLLGPTSVDEVKIMVYSIKGSRNNLLWAQKLDKPCQHIVVGALITKFLNSTNCIGKKGSVSVVINFTQIAYNFFGNSFFYGQFFMKALVSSKKGNILCMTLTAVFMKIV